MELLQQLAAVCFVLALLGAAVWFLKGKQMLVPGRSGSKQMEVVERVSLGPQHTLSLVRVNGVMMLIGTGPGVCEIRDVEVSS
jgi:flagellar biogenesis protein FliO